VSELQREGEEGKEEREEGAEGREGIAREGSVAPENGDINRLHFSGSGSGSKICMTCAMQNWDRVHLVPESGDD